MSNIASYITLGIAVVAFLGSAAVFLRGSADKGTITSLKNALDGLQEEFDVTKLKHERESAEKDARIRSLEETKASQEQRIHGLGRELAVLRNTVTQAEEIRHLQETLDNHHTQAMGQMDNLRVPLQRLVELAEEKKS